MAFAKDDFIGREYVGQFQEHRSPAKSPVDRELGDVPVRVTRNVEGGVRACRMDTGEELTVLTTYWFAWSGFHPNTQTVD